jgi:urea transport system permease protein
MPEARRIHIPQLSGDHHHGMAIGIWRHRGMQGFNGLSVFCVLLLMALGLAIIFGQMGVINMAHGEFMTIGAYTTYLCSSLTAHFAPASSPITSSSPSPCRSSLPAPSAGWWSGR